MVCLFVYYFCDVFSFTGYKTQIEMKCYHLTGAGILQPRPVSSFVTLKLVQSAEYSLIPSYRLQ